jgi:hypothetical protein
VLTAREDRRCFWIQPTGFSAAVQGRFRFLGEQSRPGIGSSSFDPPIISTQL